MRTASCLDWRRETTAERRALLAQMRAFFGAQVDSSSAPGANGAVLSDRQATTLLNGYCRQAFAAAFKLRPRRRVHVARLARSRPAPICVPAFT